MDSSEYTTAIQEALTRHRDALERETGRLASVYTAAFKTYNLRSDGGDGNRQPAH
jgi:hypothetical protein